jgi:hypothetical protein
MDWINSDLRDKALHILIEGAEALGAAKKRAVLAERMVKRVRAIECARSNAKTVSQREHEAETSASYLNAIYEEADAVGAYETLRAQRDAAEATLETWRSVESSRRAVRI